MAREVPLTLEHGKTFMCTCGNGKLPESFMPSLPNWDKLSKYAMRAEISPASRAPFARETCRLDENRDVKT